MICLGIFYYTYSKENISFKKAMGRHRFPVVVLYNNGNAYNFIVDTGATNSVLNKNFLDLIKHNKIETEDCTLYGIDGNPISVEYIEVPLYNGKKKFTEDFQVIDVPAFDKLKETENLEVAGFLGSSFLEKNKMSIDFKKYEIKVSRKIFLAISNDLFCN